MEQETPLPPDSDAAKGVDESYTLEATTDLADESTALQAFDFQAHPVRVVQQDGAPWFVATDVAQVLGLANIRKNLRQLRPDWRGVTKSYTSTGVKEVTIINEPALYKLAFRSHKPEAEAFTDWVASEVLPAIRQQGQYISRERVLELLSQKFTVKALNAFNVLFTPLLGDRGDWYLSTTEMLVLLEAAKHRIEMRGDKSGTSRMSG